MKHHVYHKRNTLHKANNLMKLKKIVFELFGGVFSPPSSCISDPLCTVRLHIEDSVYTAQLRAHYFE